VHSDKSSVRLKGMQKAIWGDLEVHGACMYCTQRISEAMQLHTHIMSNYNVEHMDQPMRLRRYSGGGGRAIISGYE